MSQAMPIAPIPSGPTTVSADIPCRKCGYNVRGLSTDRAVPSVASRWPRRCRETCCGFATPNG